MYVFTYISKRFSCPGYVHGKGNLRFLYVFATYKCVVVCGRSDAISSSLSPTEVHFTVTWNFSKRHVQFPASEHKTSDSKRLPSPSPSLASLFKLSCSRSCTADDVEEITRVNKAKSIFPCHLPCDIQPFSSGRRRLTLFRAPQTLLLLLLFIYYEYSQSCFQMNGAFANQSETKIAH